MPIEITDKLVQHIATLVRLSLTSEEKAEMQGHFEKILRYVESLDGVDTQSIDPSIFPLEVCNVFAKDESRPSLLVEDAVANAPERREGFFLVPRIVAAAPGSQADLEDD